MTVSAIGVIKTHNIGLNPLILTITWRGYNLFIGFNLFIHFAEEWLGTWCNVQCEEIFFLSIFEQFFFFSLFHPKNSTIVWPFITFHHRLYTMYLSWINNKQIFFYQCTFIDISHFMKLEFWILVIHQCRRRKFLICHYIEWTLRNCDRFWFCEIPPSRYGQFLYIVR